MDNDASVLRQLFTLWPHLQWERCSQLGVGYNCAADCGGMAINLWGAIAHLNDQHCWSRERIAAWVKTVEPAEPEVPIALEQQLLEAEWSHYPALCAGCDLKRPLNFDGFCKECQQEIDEYDDRHEDPMKTHGRGK